MKQTLARLVIALFLIACILFLRYLNHVYS
jgi:hypothetical protein